MTTIFADTFYWGAGFKPHHQEHEKECDYADQH